MKIKQFLLELICKIIGHQYKTTAVNDCYDSARKPLKIQLKECDRCWAVKIDLN